jgi:hypothetical protein
MPPRQGLFCCQELSNGVEYYRDTRIHFWMRFRNYPKNDYCGYIPASCQIIVAQPDKLDKRAQCSKLRAFFCEQAEWVGWMAVSMRTVEYVLITLMAYQLVRLWWRLNRRRVVCVQRVDRGWS